MKRKMLLTLLAGVMMASPAMAAKIIASGGGCVAWDANNGCTVANFAIYYDDGSFTVIEFPVN